MTQAADSIPRVVSDVKDLPVKHYCGSWGWFDPVTGKADPFFCGLASCGREYCQKLYHLKRVRLFTDLIPQYDLSRFFTLTLWHRQFGLYEAWDVVSTIFHRFMKALRYHHPDIRYAAILEAHPRSWYPHIHGFFDRYVWKGLISRLMEQAGGGRVVDIEKVYDTGDISDYVAKQFNVAHYIGKEQVVSARQMMKPRARTFWRSRGLFTEYEIAKREQGGNPDIVLVKERMYKETEDGLDIRHKVVYTEGMESYMLKFT